MVTEKIFINKTVFAILTLDMHDIRIPDSRGGSARGKTLNAESADFEVTHVGVDEEKKHEPSEKVKVKFTKFVQLVATHDFEEVMQKHGDDDIVLNSNLLTDLASAHQDEEPKRDPKLPIFLVVGVIIGVVITYLILRF